MNLTHELYSTSLWMRLAQLIHRRFRTHVGLTTMLDVSSLYSSNKAWQQKGLDLIIPLIWEGELLGGAQVFKGALLSPKDQEALAQIIWMTLPQALHSKLLERNCQDLERDVNSPAEKALGNLQNGDGEDDPSQKIGFRNPPRSSLLTLLHSSTAYLDKITFELHELTGAWALIPFNDIQSGLREPSDLMDLGPVVISLDLEQFLRNLNPESSRQDSDSSSSQIEDGVSLFGEETKTLKESHKQKLDPKDLSDSPEARPTLDTDSSNQPQILEILNSYFESARPGEHPVFVVRALNPAQLNKIPHEKLRKKFSAEVTWLQALPVASKLQEETMKLLFLSDATRKNPLAPPDFDEESLSSSKSPTHTNN